MKRGVERESHNVYNSRRKNFRKKWRWRVTIIAYVEEEEEEAEEEEEGDVVIQRHMAWW
jgi:hypothetical protein